MNMHLSGEWIDQPERWEALRGIWDDLVEQSARPSIFSSWDFLEACWRHFARPRGHRLAIITVSEGGRPLGFAPLRLSERRRCGWRLRRLSLLAGWESDRVPFIFPKRREEDCVLAVLRFLDQRREEWDLLELREAAAEGAVVEAARRWAAGRRDVVLLEKQGAPSPYVELPGSWEAFVSGLGPRTRKNLKRYLNRLTRLGSYELEVVDAPGRMERALDGYLQLEARSWKKAAGQGVGKNPQNEAFYRDLLPRLCRKGRGSISFLRVEGRRVAGLIELQWGRTVYAAQTAYDQDLAAYSPGAVLQALSIERHLHRGVREVELFARFLTDKMRWTRRARSNLDLTILPLRRLKHCLLLGRRSLRQLARAGAACLEWRPRRAGLTTSDRTG